VSSPPCFHLWNAREHTERERLAYGVLEAARLIGVGRSTMLKLAKEGRIARVKVCDRRLVPWAELERLVASAAPVDAAGRSRRARGVVRWLEPVS
jgi:excisionase family DNA binding protein